MKAFEGKKVKLMRTNPQIGCVIKIIFKSVYMVFNSYSIQVDIGLLFSVSVSHDNRFC